MTRGTQRCARVHMPHRAVVVVAVLGVALNADDSKVAAAVLINQVPTVDPTTIREVCALIPVGERVCSSTLAGVGSKGGGGRGARACAPPTCTLNQPYTLNPKPCTCRQRACAPPTCTCRQRRNLS